MTASTNNEYAELRRAYRDLQSAYSSLRESARELADAGWSLASGEMIRTARIVSEQMAALERFSTGLGVSL